MIIEIKGKRTRKEKFQTHKIIGKNEYELRYTDRTKLQEVNICLKWGGKLATGIGDRERREISFNKLPVDVKQQVITAIQYVENNGTPMENDESVFIRNKINIKCNDVIVL